MKWLITKRRAMEFVDEAVKTVMEVERKKQQKADDLRKSIERLQAEADALNAENPYDVAARVTYLGVTWEVEGVMAASVEMASDMGIGYWIASESIPRLKKGWLKLVRMRAGEEIQRETVERDQFALLSGVDA